MNEAKIVVKREGREGIYLPERASLLDWLREQRFDKVHNFKMVGPVLLGADHHVDDMLDLVVRADRIAITTGRAAKNNVGHALSLIVHHELQLYDIGEITDEHLEVTQ